MHGGHSSENIRVIQPFRSNIPMWGDPLFGKIGQKFTFQEEQL